MYTNSNTHAQSIAGNGFIIIPHHEFEQPSHWYYPVQQDIKYEIGVVTYGITSTPNFINFRHPFSNNKIRPNGCQL
jgi:hypothetical protein